MGEEVEEVEECGRERERGGRGEQETQMNTNDPELFV